MTARTFLSTLAGASLVGYVLVIEESAGVPWGVVVVTAIVLIVGVLVLIERFGG